MVFKGTIREYLNRYSFLSILNKRSVHLFVSLIKLRNIVTTKYYPTRFKVRGRNTIELYTFLIVKADIAEGTNLIQEQETKYLHFLL